MLLPASSKTGLKGPIIRLPIAIQCVKGLIRNLLLPSLLEGKQKGINMSHEIVNSC